MKINSKNDRAFHRANLPSQGICLLRQGKSFTLFALLPCTNPNVLPPYDNIPVYKLISYLKDVKLKSLEMRPFIEEYRAAELPDRMPDWARVNENDSSSDDELQADTRYAKECGDKLLHYILYQKYSAKKLDPETLDRLVCGRT